MRVEAGAVKARARACGVCRSQDGPALAASGPAQGLRESAMLYSWVQHRLGLYLEQLRKHLPNVTEGGNLAAVIEHCMVRLGRGKTRLVPAARRT